MTERSAEGAAVAVRRIRFVASPGAGERVLLRFGGPRPQAAVVSDLSLEALAAPAAEAPDELVVVHVAPEALRQTAEGRRAAAWFEGSPAIAAVGACPPVAVGAVRWRPGRALVTAPEKDLEPCLSALAEFAFHEGELRRLEAETAAGWAQAEADSPLMARADRAGAARSDAVADRCAAVALLRLRAAQVEPHLVAPPGAWGEAACDLGRRLRDESDVETRLEVLDGQIEVYEYIYELACQRISDYRHFHREYVVEVLIVIILGIETLMLACEAYGYLWP